MCTQLHSKGIESSYMLGFLIELIGGLLSTENGTKDSLKEAVEVSIKIFLVLLFCFGIF